MVRVRIRGAAPVRARRSARLVGVYEKICRKNTVFSEAIPVA
jgi:hypothetical protein